MNICLRDTECVAQQSWINSLVKKNQFDHLFQTSACSILLGGKSIVLVNEGLKIIDWASTAKEEEPELVIAAAGTESNLEALVAVTLLLEEFPKLKIRFINVVDLLKLRHPSQVRVG